MFFNDFGDLAGCSCGSWLLLAVSGLGGGGLRLVLYHIVVYTCIHIVVCMVTPLPLGVHRARL